MKRVLRYMPVCRHCEEVRRSNLANNNLAEEGTKNTDCHFVILPPRNDVFFKFARFLPSLRLAGFFTFAFLLFSSCQKEKFDFEKDNRFITEKRSESNVRIVNLGRYNQIVVNGDSLTNFMFINDPNELAVYPGTRYFPIDGRLGSIWTIPQELLLDDGTARVQLGFEGDLTNGALGDQDFTVQEDYANPMDYYVLEGDLVEGQPHHVAIPRDITAPSKPDHFKIRIVNLMGKPLVAGAIADVEDLVGPITLTYADGTPVDPQVTSNVSVTQRVSEYVEIPYGTYQFKVLHAGDHRQIPAADPANDQDGNINLATSSIASQSADSHLHFAPIRTYQPGGVYTIVVSPRVFGRWDGTWLYNDALQNAFKVISDIDEPLNVTYARIQGVHTLPGTGTVSLKINGESTVGSLDYASSSSYSARTHGPVKIEAVNATGQVLATVEEILRPAQNYSIWLHPDKEGNTALSLVNNDLSGNTLVTYQVTDNASYNRSQADFFFWYRFLNMSIGNPYISFTYNNGQAIVADRASAAYNLEPGEIVGHYPYASGGYSDPFRIQVYRSSPTVTPGVFADDIPVIEGTDFIANKTLYSNAGRPLPNTEAGVYTVALIGRSGTDVLEAEKARIMIVKHNR